MNWKQIVTTLAATLLGALLLWAVPAARKQLVLAADLEARIVPIVVAQAQQQSTLLAIQKNQLRDTIRNLLAEMHAMDKAPQRTEKEQRYYEGLGDQLEQAKAELSKLP